MLTGLAGLISAITGLVVAVHQLRPASQATAPPTQASASVTNLSATTTSLDTGSSAKGAGSIGSVQVKFLEGRHAQVGSGRYDVLIATARAGNPGERTLALHVRMTNDGRFPANFWSSTFRLRVGSDITAPTNFLDDVVAAGATDTGEVDFTLPASTQRAALLVGDDPAHAVTLPISLGNGHA